MEEEKEEKVRQLGGENVEELGEGIDWALVYLSSISISRGLNT